jgi:hypothetical protein
MLLLLGAATIAPVQAPGQSRLFDSHEPLELRIVSDFRGLMAERDSLDLELFPATIGYVAAPPAPLLAARPSPRRRRRRRRPGDRPAA